MRPHALAHSYAVVLIVLFAATYPKAVQVLNAPEIWRDFAKRLEPGATIVVRTTNGQRVTASLLQVSDDAIAIQPKTRVPVPPQRIAFGDIASLEVQRASGGLGIAKAVAIGAAVGAGAFLTLLLIAVSALD